MNAAPVVRDVVLVGGGHSHALVIRRWAMRPLAGVRLTLVSREVLTPYSGMLPGLVAGHYAPEDIHIDLRRLCAWAGVRFIRAEMTGLDLERREIELLDGVADEASDAGPAPQARAPGHPRARRPPLAWDLLSLDTGSTPDLSVPGAREHTTPVKPVSDFHARWQAIRERLASGATADDPADDPADGPTDDPFDGAAARPLSIGVIGSGAGGFELIMAMRHALPPGRAECHWVLRRDVPLAGRPPRLGERALAAARRAGVAVHADFDVVRVREEGVEARDGRFLKLDETLWCTAATGPEWPAAAGLATDERGFVATDRHLRSVSHPHLFATGDIGTQRDTPSAKAGVFAVRQAPVLFENLRRTLLGEPLERYVPQRDFLSLMATGGRSAIASRGPFVVEGEAVWRWKDRIDRRFMERFAVLPPMMPSRVPAVVPDALLADAGGPDADADADHDAAREELAPPGGAMRCRGCGAKVGMGVLDEVLGTLEVAPRADVLAGLAEAGDAAVLATNGRALVQSVDQLDAIVDDPWLFGRIAALHALSDVVTEPARVQSAQVLATLPHAHERITRRELGQLMHGIVGALAEEGGALVGGHTAEGGALAVGLVVNALANTEPDPSGSGDGEVLILTQAIGIGTLFAALARGRARGADIETALADMARGNRAAADVLRAHGAASMTDVTGFGLLGHLTRLLRGRDLAARVDVAAVPLLPGALALAGEGVHSSSWPAARRLLDAFDGARDCSPALRYLLCDPQTGGGLLGIVPAARAADCVAALRASGYRQAVAVGQVSAAPAATARHALLRGGAGSSAPSGPPAVWASG